MLFENEIAKVGYLSRSVPEGIDLKEAILKMKVEKNAVILAHYYVSEDIQSIADFVGDSFAGVFGVANSKAVNALVRHLSFVQLGNLELRFGNLL
jgi:quinolinate synthase